jgi:transcriptional regulator with XRE-family HTH domain
MDTEITDQFAWVEWIIAERIAHEWSQSELARRAKTTRQTINDYEARRRTEPDPEILGRISLALGFPADHLVRLVKYLPPEPNQDNTLYKINHLYHTLKDQASKARALEYLEFLSQQEEKNDRKGKGSK